MRTVIGGLVAAVNGRQRRTAWARLRLLAGSAALGMRRLPGPPLLVLTAWLGPLAVVSSV